MVDEANNETETMVPPGTAIQPPAFDQTMRLDRIIAGGDLSLPSHFGRYEVTSRIGVGGFASVYAAIDPELQSSVAVKVLAENHSADVEVRRRFVAEARVARRLGTDRLIGVFDVGETEDGRPYVVMELADRGTLRARLSIVGRPDNAALLRFIEELGACLSAIHEHGIIHRDIKPSNLLLRSAGTEAAGRPHQLVEIDERLLLADFGLARDISAGASAVTVGGGTAGYMAPEQADPEGKADFRADIYAATVVLAEVATRRHPERLDLGTSKLPPVALEALGRSLSMDRELRPASAQIWCEQMLAAFSSDMPTELIEPTASDVQSTARIQRTKVQPPVMDDFDDEDESLFDVSPRPFITPFPEIEPPPPPPGLPVDQPVRPPVAPPRKAQPHAAAPQVAPPQSPPRRTAPPPTAAHQTTPPPQQAPPPPTAPPPTAAPQTAPPELRPAERAAAQRPLPPPPRRQPVQPASARQQPVQPQTGAPHVSRPLTPQPPAQQPQTPQQQAQQPPTPRPPTRKADSPQAGPRPLAPPIVPHRDQRTVPVGDHNDELPPLPEKLSKRQTKAEAKAERARARQILRRARHVRISNFFRTIIRGLLGMITAGGATAMLAAARANANGVDQLSERAEGLVGAAGIAGLLLGTVLFPWPRNRKL